MTYCKVVSSNTSRLQAHAGYFIVGNHIKLEICSFVMNFNSAQGVFSKVTVLCCGYWL